MSAIAVVEPARREDDEYVAALQELLGTPLAIWTQLTPGGWELTSSSSSYSEDDSPLGTSNLRSRHVTTKPASEPQPPLVTALLEQTSRRRELRTTELSPGQQLLAIPLPGPRCSADRIAVATVATDNPQLLLQLAKASQHCLQQQQELGRLREENGCFVSLVSNDFEELTFLRSLAERLALGDEACDLTTLTQYTLPLLGEAARVEGLYYLDDRSGEGPRLADRWEASGGAGQRLDPAQLEDLVKQFRQDAAERPVLKNQVDRTELGRQLPGVRELLLVSVSTTVGPLGWLLAVNRRERFQIGVQKVLNESGPSEFGTSDASLVGTAAAMMASHAHNVAFLDEKESLLVNIVRTLVSAVDSRDPYTCGHSERVALFAKCLAQETGLDEDACQQAYLMGLLHDVGKIGISDAILNKPGRLTDEEYDEIKRHAELGWNILHDLTQLDYVLPGVLHHHERMDGAGYPDGLHGEEIPWEGRLLAVVDAYDAMTSDRPYRSGMTQENATAILAEGAGSQWDEEIVAAFLRVMPEILTIQENYRRPQLTIRKQRQLPDAKQLARDEPADSPVTSDVTADSAKP